MRVSNEMSQILTDVKLLKTTFPGATQMEKGLNFLQKAIIVDKFFTAHYAVKL